MTVVVHSGCLQGVGALAVVVEVDILSALPCFQVVGLPHSSVRESRERVRSAIEASDLPFPRRRITVNLAPADRPKRGTGLDLPIALGVVAAAAVAGGQQQPWDRPPVAIGELGLDGVIRPVPGVLPVVEAAVEAGAESVLVPSENEDEARLVPGVSIHGVHTLQQAWAVARGAVNLHEAEATSAGPTTRPRGQGGGDGPVPDLHEVRGLDLGRRVLEVAAAGGHGVLLEGPPGSGKSMLARRLAGLLPDLASREALAVTRIRSAAGLLAPHRGLVLRPPLRSPHHTASTAAVIGGGCPLRPGEVTLAHGGVLLLDEAPEFQTRVLESLRQPLEEGEVRVSRIRETVTFPARFHLVATANPCPCGFLGSDTQTCRCLPGEQHRYRRRLSGPLIDRIDLAAWVDPVSPDTLLSAPAGESSAVVRERVEQVHRLRTERGWATEGPAQPSIETCLEMFGRPGRRELKAALASRSRSGRSLQQLVRVACTIADLDGSEQVGVAQVQEGLLLTTRHDPSQRTRASTQRAFSTSNLTSTPVR